MQNGKCRCLDTVWLYEVRVPDCATVITRFPTFPSVHGNCILSKKVSLEAQLQSINESLRVSIHHRTIGVGQLVIHIEHIFAI